MQTVPDSLFRPASVAIIGAGEKPGQIGSGLCCSITDGFCGPVFYVNPQYRTLWGGPCYASILEVPQRVSHAVIAVNRSRVLPCLRQCAQAGVRHVIVISAGFKETDAEGAALEAEMTALCERENMVLLGPNTLGLINTAARFNCTFLPDHILPGKVSVISQSGGVGMAILASLRDQRCGVAKWAGIGNQAVLDAEQFLRYFAQDPETAVIAVCFEGLHDLPGFLRLAAEDNRTKPVVLLRDGKSSTGKKAASSHTGAMVQSTQVMHDLIAQYGLLEADGCRSCAVMLKALSMGRRPAGTRTVVLSNTAGPAILAADRMESLGVSLPQPSQALRDRVDALAGRTMQLKNPADISSNGLTPETYRIAAQTLLSAPEYDLLLSFFSLNRHLTLPDAELIEAVRAAGKPAVACFLCSNEEFAAYDRRPEQAGIPCFCDPEDAANAVAAMTGHAVACARVRRDAEPVLTPEQARAAADYLAGLACTVQTVLPERISRQLLALAGFPVAVPAAVETADEAAAAAERFGYPAALKVESCKITHKTEARGVRLGLQDGTAVRAAFAEMQPAMRRLDPEARLTVQPMAADGFELMLGGARLDGAPLLAAGMGGIYAEVLRDTAFRLAPLAEGEPERMLSSLRCAPILDGFRTAPLDRAAAAALLRRLAELMQALPQLAEIDLNPCRVYARGCAILDARIVVKP